MQRSKLRRFQNFSITYEQNKIILVLNTGVFTQVENTDLKINTPTKKFDQIFRQALGDKFQLSAEWFGVSVDLPVTTTREQLVKVDELITECLIIASEAAPRPTSLLWIAISALLGALALGGSVWYMWKLFK